MKTQSYQNANAIQKLKPGDDKGMRLLRVNILYANNAKLLQFITFFYPHELSKIDLNTHFYYSCIIISSTLKSTEKMG